jgi:metal-sulfur cluster biosynthetic enzyme
MTTPTSIPSTNDVLETLKTVFDPEIGINIVDLGLIYGVEELESDGGFKVTFTLTTPACPVGPMIQAQIREAVETMDGVDEVETEIVFSPPWDPREMASDEAKFELGIF